MNIPSTKNVVAAIQRMNHLWEPPTPRSTALLKSAPENQETLDILAQLEHWDEAWAAPDPRR